MTSSVIWRSLVTIVGTAITSLLLLTSPARAGGELNLMTWEGFADPSFVSIFEAQTGCKVTATYIGNNEEIFAKLSIVGGTIYDAVSPDIDATGILTQMGVIEPLDVGRLEHWDEIPTSFTDLPGVQSEGQIWALPWTWVRSH